MRGVNRNQQIDEIERFAREISSNNQLQARALMVRWSAFVVESGQVISIDGKTWPQVSDKWVRRIYIMGHAAYKKWAHKKGITLPGENISLDLKEDPAKLMTMEGYDNGADLPF